MSSIDLRAAMNAISDVIANRPTPLRMYDQIHMKAADMVLQSEYVARWSAGESLAFVGDGDGIGMCTAHLVAKGIVQEGPSSIHVFDFDERVVNSIDRFAAEQSIPNLTSELYNCFDALPEARSFDRFYTNPPWGASNAGESVDLFVQRGVEAIRNNGTGLIVIADDQNLQWTREVIANTQDKAIERGFYVSRMMPSIHEYHLDDDPELRSCNLEISSVYREDQPFTSIPIPDPRSLRDFYGEGQAPEVRYVREPYPLTGGEAENFELEMLEEEE